MCCHQNIIENIILSSVEPWKMNCRKEFANMLGTECCKVSVTVSALVHWPPSSLDNYMLLTLTSLRFHLHMVFLFSYPEIRYRAAVSSLIIERFKSRQSSILSYCLQIV